MSLRLLSMLLLLPCLAISAVASAADPVSPESGEWQTIFNGKDLTGWTPKIRGHEAGENFGETFRVEEGILKVRFDQYEGRYRGRFGHLFYDQELSNYRLRLEYRFNGEQAEGAPGWAILNSGIMMHGQSPQSMALDQMFPVSLEVQLLAGTGDGDRPTANLCTPGTHFHQDGKLNTSHCNSSSSPTFAGDEWVKVEVQAMGGKVIRHLINDKVVFEYERPMLDETDETAKPLLAAGASKDVTGGTISLQAEGHPCDFRNIELMMISEK